MTYEAWRIQYQDPEKACQEAFIGWMRALKRAHELRLDALALNTMSYEQLKQYSEQAAEQAQ